ncbi:hypothetical protein KOR34_45350 [Posidoniimonas corsicana]|uniref:Uncharacterized protein n=1 Tax=Posidoniimonas corsicana TaxID=1938618 RepID=A0A5C5UZ82_9BACT|nr:hypothetical protein [Posidoniimonas corsicana]TWT31159.1 hypothetical protein KOR34_45350 [Posidoniimonas corsicana]
MTQMLQTQNVGLKAKATQSSAAADKLRQDSQAARRTLIGLCVRLVEGGQVTDDELTKARVAADATAADVAQMIDTLEQRKAAYDAHHNNDFAAKEEEQRGKTKPAHELVQACEKAAAAAREKLREATEAYQRCLSLASSYSRQQDVSRREMAATLGKTGDASDWRGIYQCLRPTNSHPRSTAPSMAPWF